MCCAGGLSSAQLFKLYISNQRQAFFGFYSLQERKVTLNGNDESIYDLMGKDTTLFHHQKTETETDTESLYVDEARRWFESLWGSVAQTHS